MSDTDGSKTMSDSELNSRARSSAAAGAEWPSLAVVIPTLNRSHDLAIAVRTLLEQSVLPAELIVVDQSRDNESERAVRALFMERTAAHIGLRYVRDSRISGAAMARNVALDALEQNGCNIVLFLDDDVELEEDFVERLLEGYAEDPEVTGISGIITNYKPGGFANRAWQWIFMRGPFRDERQWLYHRAEELRGAGRIAVSRFGGGLMSFRAERVKGLRFDENLSGGSEGEDVDFCMHLPAGARLEIDPRARLVHNASTAARKDEHWIGSVVRGNSYLYYRNWRKELGNRIAFGWLMTGFAMVAVLASAKRGSPAPWKAFRAAMRYGKKVGLGQK
jgi:GT2 family glycosyltransferase